MQAIERLETEKTIIDINDGESNPHKEIIYEIFYDGRKRQAVIQGLRKKGLRNKMNIRLRTMAQEYNPH